MARLVVMRRIRYTIPPGVHHDMTDDQWTDVQNALYRCLLLEKRQIDYFERAKDAEALQRKFETKLKELSDTPVARAIWIKQQGRQWRHAHDIANLETKMQHAEQAAKVYYQFAIEAQTDWDSELFELRGDGWEPKLCHPDVDFGSPTPDSPISQVLYLSKQIPTEHQHEQDWYMEEYHDWDAWKELRGVTDAWRSLLLATSR